MEQPFKRRRISSNACSDEELERRRARNDLRLKSAFEFIFEKYGKDFSGIGDEIDLKTNKIVTNHGHISAMRDEKDPGRAEDLYDELEGENWSGENKETTDQGHVRPENLVPFFRDSLPSALSTGMGDLWQSTDEPANVMDIGTGISTNAADELARDGIEPTRRAPPIPSNGSNHQENLYPQNLHTSEACEDRPMSPPGRSLWAPQSSSMGGKKHQLARKRESFTPLSIPSKLPLSSIEQSHDRRSMPSLNVERSKKALPQTSKQGEIILPTTTPQVPPKTCESVGHLPWTEYEDHKLYYLRSEAGMTFSEMANSFPGRTKTEIKERWFTLYPADNNLPIRGAKYQKNNLISSVEVSDVTGHGTGFSSIHRRSPGKPNTLRSLKKQLLQSSGLAAEQMPLVESRNIEQIPPTDRDSRNNSTGPNSGTTMDQAIDLTLSDGEESSKPTNTEDLTAHPKHKSKQGGSFVNDTQGILKRATRKLTATNKAKRQPVIKTKCAVAGDEADAPLPLDFPEAQNQPSPDSTLQKQQPARSHSRRKIAITRAWGRKPLATNLVVVKAHNQKLSSPRKPVTPSLQIDTDAWPSSSVATRSSTLSQNSKRNNTNSDSHANQARASLTQSLTSTSPMDASAASENQFTDSVATGERENILSDAEQSKADKVSTKCSAKITIRVAATPKDDLLSNSCISQISRRPRSLNRPASPCETDRGQDPLDSNNHTNLRSREDSEESDFLHEPQPLRIITTTSQLRRRQKPPSDPSYTPNNPKVMGKPKPKPDDSLHTKKIFDDLSDDELSTPVQRKY